MYPRIPSLRLHTHHLPLSETPFIKLLTCLHFWERVIALDCLKTEFASLVDYKLMRCLLFLPSTVPGTELRLSHGCWAESQGHQRHGDMNQRQAEKGDCSAKQVSEDRAGQTICNNSKSHNSRQRTHHSKLQLWLSSACRDQMEWAQLMSTCWVPIRYFSPLRLDFSCQYKEYMCLSLCTSRWEPGYLEKKKDWKLRSLCCNDWLLCRSRELKTAKWTMPAVPTHPYRRAVTVQKPRSHAVVTCQVTGLRELFWDVHSGTERQTWLLACPRGLRLPP